MGKKGDQPLNAIEVHQGSFDVESHYYTKVINANIHPLVSYFFNLGLKRMVARYCHLNPTVDKDVLVSLLTKPPEVFRWAGADLFYVTDKEGNRQMTLIETNSCPSGQKSMPLLNEHDETGGYSCLMKQTLMEAMKRCKLPEGVLAVIYDKNLMEARGYACVMADVFDEVVYLVEFYEDDDDPPARWTSDLVLEVRTADGKWLPVRTAFRYVTQRPWKRFPLCTSKTLVMNPVVACIAGGRNKLVASKAYDLFNAQYSNAGISISTPETIRDVGLDEVPLWVSSFGGNAVVKVPYSNAGQGVFTITKPEELEAFMKEERERNTAYDSYIVQSLIGDYEWSSVSRAGQQYHVGTIPDKHGNIFVADIRMMVNYDYASKMWRPLAIYSRRARKPLENEISADSSTWDVLGTNLSLKQTAGGWDTDTSRLMIMDRRDFNRLGIGMDDLIDAYVQTVMAAIAIDDIGQQLIVDAGSDKQRFNIELFRSLNKDDQFEQELFLDWESEQKKKEAEKAEKAEKAA